MEPPANLSPDALDGALQRHFGIDAFRTGQREVIESVLADRDALVVMPTGSGKSLCYQLPAMVKEGLTLVVSPLIALMKDQVDGLRARGLPAACINSTISASGQKERLLAARRGALKLLFIAPERFRVVAFMEALRETKIALLAIDEAHCISQWGHDFRPDYLRLGEVREALGMPTTVALTATATPFVRDDIIKQLRLRDTEAMVFGFERDNLYFQVSHAPSHRSKVAATAALANHAGGGGIVYCSTRKQVEKLAPQLAAAGLRVGAYHAGLKDLERELVQNRFMKDAFDVLVATNAFGMGVDKSDLRFVVHNNMPGSLEAYYQEAGRAGRDQHPAHCLLLYNYADTSIHEFFVKNSYPQRPLIQAVYRLLVGQGADRLIPWSTADISRLLGPKVHDMAVGSALRALRQAGHIERVKSPPGLVVMEQLPIDALKVNYDAFERRANVERERLKRMVFYATTRRCRTLNLLKYFGSREVDAGGCGHCDNCKITTTAVYAEEAVAAHPRRQRPSSKGPVEGLVCLEPKRVVVIKVLSCVARMQGRHDLNHVAAVLVGSQARAVIRARLDKISTYGLLGYLRRGDVEFLVDQCFQARLITFNRRHHAELTAKGREVMLDKKTELPETLREALKKAFPLPPSNDGPWRPGDVVRKKPASRAGRASSHDTLEVTRQLMSVDPSIERVATKRGLTPKTIRGHLIKLAEQRRCPDLTPLLDGALLPKVRSALEAVGGHGSMRALKNVLDQRVTDQVLGLHIAHLLQTEGGADDEPEPLQEN